MTWNLAILRHLFTNVWNSYCQLKVAWLALHNGGMKRTAKLKLTIIHGLLDGYNRSATLKVSRNHFQSVTFFFWSILQFFVFYIMSVYDRCWLASLQCCSVHKIAFHWLLYCYSVPHRRNYPVHCRFFLPISYGCVIPMVRYAFHSLRAIQFLPEILSHLQFSV